MLGAQDMHATTKALPTVVRHVSARAASAILATIATTPEEVEKLRDAWSALPVTNIDADIDYFLTVVRNAKRVIRPHVVHIRRENQPDLMAVARIEQMPVTFRFGYRVLGQASLPTIVLAFDGILGARCREDEELVLYHLHQSLQSGEADLILMPNIDVDSTLHAAATAAVRGACRARAQRATRRWMAVIPDSLDEFLSERSAKTRSTLRRQDRQLRDQFGERMRLRRFDSHKEMDELCRDMEMVASRTYQRGLGVSFTGTPLALGLIDLCLRQGWHRTWMLYLDDRPVAFWTGTAYAGTFAIGTPGFDPDHARDSVGRYTMFRMIEDLCADSEISMLDYGQGEAEYKSAFGNHELKECDVLLAARRPKAMLVMLGFSMLSAVNNQSRRLVERSAWARKLKASWRRRIAESRKP